MRLIDADALKEKMRRTNRYFGVKFDIDEAPTIDAEPVRHGHWKKRKSWTHMVCSACSFEVPYDIFNYCPNCGAKMDGGERMSDKVFVDKCSRKLYNDECKEIFE